MEFFIQCRHSQRLSIRFKNIPSLFEGVDDLAFETSHHLADSISERVYILSSEARKHLHLAAVFACNFVNHCYEISSELLGKHDIRLM